MNTCWFCTHKGWGLRNGIASPSPSPPCTFDAFGERRLAMRIGSGFVLRCACGLALMAACVGWFASYGWPATVHVGGASERAWFVRSARGELTVVRRTVTPPPTGGIQFDLSRPDRIGYTRRGGSGWVAHDMEDLVAGGGWLNVWRTGKTVSGISGVRYQFRTRGVALPYTLLSVVAAAILAAACLPSFRRRLAAGNTRRGFEVVGQ